ncbi:hypothetical protein GQ54DRAFT_296112 [Martensiomyces pterosporus]|nr:hypothetical protein GQ54DRAFT_296112 [Martensiomyces pterosporus]
MAGVGSAEHDSIRLFLDGQFATLDSLELVDELLRDEERTHTLLEAELEEARAATATLFAESKAAVSDTNSKSAELLTLHSEVVGSAGDEAASAWQFRDGSDIMKLVEALAAELRTHERLSQAKVYVDLLVDIEKTREQATQQIAKSTQSALAAFSHIISVLAKYEPPAGWAGDGELASTRSTGATIPPHLLEYLKEVAKCIWSDVDKAAAETQSGALRKLGWPGKMDLTSAAALGAFSSGFSTLTSLDRITRDSQETLSRHGISLRTKDASPLPLEHLARAVDIRMRYHFESNRQTNRADKPEWWLSQLLSTLRNTVPFFEGHVQSLYNASGLPPLDMRNEFIQLVLPTVRRKLSLDRPAYLDAGLVIAHVAHELRDFEQTLRDVYFFDGASVLEEFLGDSKVFGAWVEAERVGAIDSYMDTVRDPSAFNLLYDDSGVLGTDDAKPSRISEKVVQLVEDITERYSVVPSCMQRLQLLSATQFPLVIALVEDIEAEIDEFSRISLAFIRDGGIGNATNASSGTAQSPLVAQLKRLVVWYQAAWFVEEAAREWSNSAIFVDMWAAACRRSNALDSNADPRDWRDDAENWDEKDRAILDAHDQKWSDSDEWLDGGIWERSIGTLRELKQRVSDLMSRAVNKDAVGQLRAYRKKDSWAPDDCGADYDAGVSVELGSFLPELSSILSSLGSLVPSPAFTRIVRLLANELDAFLVERVATAHSFNSLGGRQFSRDVSAVSQVLRSPGARGSAPSSSNRAHLRILLKAKECGLVLACPLEGLPSSTSDSAIPLSLNEWGHAITDPAADGQEASMLLKKLGIKHLSLKEVRQLVSRRRDFLETGDSLR